MKLPVTLDARRGRLRVDAERALDYPARHVAQLVAAATSHAIAAGISQPRPPRSDHAGQTDSPVRQRPAELPAAVDHGRRRASSSRDDEFTRRRVLRMLDDGAPVHEAAERFGVDPAQIDQRYDDAALDARTDVLADALG